LAYFKDKSKWDPTITDRARTLLAHIFKVYEAETAPTARSKPTTPASPSKSFFMEAIRSLNPEQLQAAAGSWSAISAARIHVLMGMLWLGGSE